MRDTCKIDPVYNMTADDIGRGARTVFPVNGLFWGRLKTVRFRQCQKDCTVSDGMAWRGGGEVGPCPALGNPKIRPGISTRHLK